MSAFKITLKPDAVADLDRLRKYGRTLILDAIETHLRIEPTRESRSRIKRLRGPQPAEYRLRVDEYRVFSRIAGHRVQVLRVMHKAQTAAFYREEST